MTIDQKALEKARDAYRRETLPVYPIVPANHDKALETAITAYFAALPTSDHAALAERLESALRDMPSLNHAPINKAMYRRTMLALAATVREAATVIQTLHSENARLEGEAEAWAAQLHHAEYDRDFNEKARANWKSRAEAAEQQVRDMREGLEPFARVGDIFELRAGNRPNSDDDPVTEWEDHRVGARRLTVGDFRRARLLLKEGGE